MDRQLGRRFESGLLLDFLYEFLRDSHSIEVSPFSVQRMGTASVCGKA